MATSLQATDQVAVSIDGAPAVSLGKSMTYSSLPAVDVIEEVITGSATDQEIELTDTELDRWSYFQMYVSGGELDVKYVAAGAVIFTIDDLLVVRGKGINTLLGTGGPPTALPSIFVDNPGSSAVTLKIVIGRDSTP